MAAGVLTSGLLLLFVLIARGFRRSSWLSLILVAVWSVAAFIQTTGVLNFRRVSPSTSLYCFVFVASWALASQFALYIHWREGNGPTRWLSQSRPDPRRRRWLISGFALTFIAFAGSILFVRSIADAAVVSTSELSMLQLRYYSSVSRVFGSAYGGLVALSSLAFFAFVEARVPRRRLIALSTVLLAPLLIVPSRTLVVSVVITSASYYIVRHGLDRRLAGSADFRRRASLLAAVGAMSIIGYFSWTGAALDKAGEVGRLISGSTLPAPLFSLLSYSAGSLSALDAQIAGLASPAADGAWKTLWLPLRVAEWATLGAVEAPDTVAAATHIPVWFNTYTALGDALADGGMLYPLVLAVGTGYFTGMAEAVARASRGALSSFVLASLIWPTMASVNVYSFFWLQAPLLIAAAAVVVVANRSGFFRQSPQPSLAGRLS